MRRGSARRPTHRRGHKSGRTLEVGVGQDVWDAPGVELRMYDQN